MSKILIVEDNSIIAKMLKTTLMLEGHDVSIAPNGTAGLEKAQEEMPDLVLLDIMMPGMDGFEVCRRLRGGEETKDIPIVFLSNLYQSQHQELARQLGALDYLVKVHMAPPQLAEKVKEILVRIEEDKEE